MAERSADTEPASLALRDTPSARRSRVMISSGGHTPATIRSTSTGLLIYGPRQSPYDVAVCTDDSPASVAAAVRHDVEPAFEIDLEPVDSVAVLTLMDNVTDNLMADHGPARRADPARSPWRPLAMMAEGRTPD